MSKVRVYEVAKQLNMDQKTLVSLFQSMGIGDVRNHMSAVETDAVERVKRHLQRQKSPDMAEERLRADGRVVKRRSRAVEPEVGAPPSPPSSVEALSTRAAPSAPGSVPGDRLPPPADSTPSVRQP